MPATSSARPRVCLPSRAFPFREAYPASPQDPAPLPFVGITDAAPGPCSARESVTTPDRVQSASTVALLGFPCLEPPDAGPCPPVRRRAAPGPPPRQCVARGRHRGVKASPTPWRDPRTACRPRATPATQRRGEGAGGGPVLSDMRQTSPSAAAWNMAVCTRSRGPRRPSDPHAACVDVPGVQRPAHRADPARHHRRDDAPTRAFLVTSHPSHGPERGAVRLLRAPLQGRAVGDHVGIRALPARPRRPGWDDHRVGPALPQGGGWTSVVPAGRCGRAHVASLRRVAHPHAVGTCSRT